MTRNGQVEVGLKRIADDYHLPGGGRMKFSQSALKGKKEHASWRQVITNAHWQ
jgi:hypothetical protein